jgi:hypothetical protein
LANRRSPSAWAGAAPIRSFSLFGGERVYEVVAELLAQLEGREGVEVVALSQEQDVVDLLELGLAAPLERVMNFAGKRHRNAESSVSSVPYRFFLLRICKPLLSEFITASSGTP